MHRRFASNLGVCFRDLGVAAAYALAAGILVALVASVDDHSLGFGWVLFDVGALPVGVMALICCEAALGTLREARLSQGSDATRQVVGAAPRRCRCATAAASTTIANSW